MAHPLLSKLNFSLGRNPRIEKRRDWRRFIPEPFSAVVLIQVDFEMAWASRWSKRFKNDPDGVLQNARRERKNIPTILDLCDRFQIPLTWATVGHLMLDGCRSQGGIAHHELPRPGHFENEFWRFTEGDWYKHDPETDVLRDPEWYACDLVNDILGRHVKHEIACHTFSHIDCREVCCPPELMRAELSECKRLATKYGLELKSFVHPGHTIGNLKVLSEEGFKNYRADRGNILGYPKKDANNLWKFDQTTEIAFRKEWSAEYHIHRYAAILKRAIMSNTVCVFWLHPSVNPIVTEKILLEFFAFIRNNSGKIWAPTTGKYVEWLEKKRD